MGWTREGCPAQRHPRHIHMTWGMRAGRQRAITQPGRFGAVALLCTARVSPSRNVVDEQQSVL